MVREVELIHSEMISNSETLLIFEVIFNGKAYHTTLTLNTGLPVIVQNSSIEAAVDALAYMDRNDAAYSTKGE